MKKVNPACAGFHLHLQMASCILSASKYFQYLKITCACSGQKRFRSQRF